jgi:hypothetical protein
MTTVRPIQSFSMKPGSSLPVVTMMSGRNRRASKRPCGYSSRRRSMVDVVSRCPTAMSKTSRPASQSRSRSLCTQDPPCRANTPPRRLKSSARLARPRRLYPGRSNGALRTSTCIVTRQQSAHITLSPPSAALADIRSQRMMPLACGSALPASSALTTEPASVPVSFRPSGCSPITDLARFGDAVGQQAGPSQAAPSSCARQIAGTFPVRKRPQQHPRPG